MTQIFSTPIPVVVLALTAAVAIAACGSSSNPTGRHTRRHIANSPFAMSQCMRDHGLKNFPDPVSTPGGEGFPGGVVSTAGSDSLTVDGITFAGPAYKAAAAACKQFLPPGGQPPALSNAQKQRILAMARCMRSHGVPNFPDPTFGKALRGAAKIPSVSPSSPAFQQAANACGAAHGGRIQIPVGS
jgi:hypothetical protein